MKRSIFKITDLTSNTLSNREHGRKIRAKIKDLISKNGNITIDMQNLTSFTPSFLDEVIITLVVELGKKEFKEKVELINLNSSLKSLLNSMLSNKLKNVA